MRPEVDLVNDGHGTGQRAEQNEAAAAHATVAHEPDAAHGHGEAAEGLGPIDWPAWIAGAIGVVAGLLVLLALYLAGNGGV